MTNHILVIHRWRDHHAHYAEYINHHTTHVTYITTPLAHTSIPPQATDILHVTATDNYPEVRKATNTLITRHGHPTHIIALNEGDLETAAQLRADLNIPGQHPEQLDRFRDKLTMAQIITDGGIHTPAYADAPDTPAIATFAETHGWPLIIKPRRGTASRAVTKIHTPHDLTQLPNPAPEPRIVQTYCPDPIYHLDGLWQGTHLGPWRASRYLNTCADFTHGHTLGSVEEDHPPTLQALEEFLTTTAPTLSPQPWVFHIEAFVGHHPDHTPHITFLEAGNRTGGAEIPFTWREVHHRDLMAAATQIQLGQTPTLPPIPPNPHPIAGWLLIPTPIPPPCQVTTTHLPPTPNGPYTTITPQPGTIIPNITGYEHTAARFRYQGTTTTHVTNAINHTTTHYQLHCTPHPPTTPTIDTTNTDPANTATHTDTDTDIDAATTTTTTRTPTPAGTE